MVQFAQRVYHTTLDYGVIERAIEKLYHNPVAFVQELNSNRSKDWSAWPKELFEMEEPPNFGAPEKGHISFKFKGCPKTQITRNRFLKIFGRNILDDSDILMRVAALQPGPQYFCLKMVGNQYNDLKEMLRFIVEMPLPQWLGENIRRFDTFLESWKKRHPEVPEDIFREAKEECKMRMIVLIKQLEDKTHPFDLEQICLEIFMTELNTIA